MKKRFGLLSLLLVMVMSLAGCKAESSLGKEYQNYIDGIMDCSYLGQTNRYMEVTDATAEESQEIYDITVENYAYQLMSFNAVDPDFITEDTLNKYIELAKTVMGKVKYTVNDAVKVNDDWQVKVDIQPIDFNDITYDAVEKYIEEFDKTYQGTDFAAMSEEEYAKIEEEYALKVLDILNSYVSSVGYKETVSKIVVITVDSEGYYGIDDSEWIDIDSTVVDMVQ